MVDKTVNSHQEYTIAPSLLVPAGGPNGVWVNAVGGGSSSFTYNWDSTNKGINFSGKFGTASTIWYPAAGSLSNEDGSLSNVGSYGYWWSCTPYGSDAYGMFLKYTRDVYPSGGTYRARGRSVRCQKEE